MNLFVLIFIQIWKNSVFLTIFSIFTCDTLSKKNKDDNIHKSEALKPNDRTNEHKQ